MDNCNLVFDANGYLPNGMRVFVKNIPLDSYETAVADMLRITNKLLADGLTLDDPAFGKLEAGEMREKVNGVLRRQYMEDDGSTVPVIDIYPDNPALGRRCVFYYLNDDKQIAEFEAATGLKLADLPLYSEPQLNRVEKPELAKKFIVAVKTNVSVVFKDNPAYDANAAKKKPKHLFIRWETATAQPKPEAPQPVSPATVPAGEPAKAEPQRNARLQNEEIVITEIVYTGTVTSNSDKAKNGDKFDGFGLIEDGGMKHRVRVWIFPEDVIQIKAHGYDFGVGKGYEIPVIMDTSDRAMTRIGSVLPNANQPDRKWDAAAWEAVMDYATLKGLQVESIKDVLGVNSGGQWKRGFKAAIAAVDAYVGVDFDAMPKAKAS